VHFEKLEAPFAGEVGQSILDRFGSHDFVIGATDEELLSARFRVADGVEWRQAVRWIDGKPAPADRVRLVQSFGLHHTHEMDLFAARLVGGFDGGQTLAQVFEEAVSEQALPRDVARRDCLNLVRWLADKGFLRFD
jgi:hypothetical protein